MPGYRGNSAADRADPDEIVEAEARRPKRGLPWRFWLVLGMTCFILAACLALGLYVIAWWNDPHGTGLRVTTLFDTSVTVATVLVVAVPVAVFLWLGLKLWRALVAHPVHARDDRYPALVNWRGQVVMLDNQQPRGRHVHQIVNTYDTPALPAPATVEADPAQATRMPKVFFRDILPRLGPGQMFLGMRADGTPRFGTWEEYKSVCVLGTSSSGKTTSIAELMAEAALDGALFVVCDPHAHKQDSLTNKIKPLTGFLYPGTFIAIQHQDCLRNARLVREILEYRIATPGTHDRKIVLIVEEWNRLQRDEQIAKELAFICEVLGQEGRGYNVFGVFGTQGMIGFAKQRRVFISYIVHNIDEAEARRIIPEPFAKLAPHLPPGATFFKDADHKTEPLQRALVEASDLREIAQVATPPRLPVAAWEVPTEHPQLPALPMKPGYPPEEPLPIGPQAPVFTHPAVDVPTPPPAPVPAAYYGESKITPIDSGRGGGGVGGVNPSRPRWSPEQYHAFLQMRQQGMSITAIATRLSTSSNFIYKVKEMEQYALLSGDLKLATMGEPLAEEAEEDEDEDAEVRGSESEARRVRGY